MAITLVELTRNTRGLNSREIKFNAIGKYITKKVQKESKPEFNEDGTPKLDEKGNQIRTPLGKDAEGKLITIEEEVQEFVTEGVLTDIADALTLVNGDDQVLLDCFAEGYNARAYELEAGKDELDEFLSEMKLDDEQKTVFKRTARGLAKNYDISILDAANMVKTLMEKQKAKASK